MGFDTTFQVKEGFLRDLADQLSLGENKNPIDAAVNGRHVDYGMLGDFASKFDQSAQRNYLEEGYLRKDPLNIDSKQFEILMQQPSATVLIKKRMFSSVGDNYRLDFMDQEEKMYYKAMTYLFQNKCKQIAILEKLSKIQKISSAMGTVDEQLMSIIFTLGSDLSFLEANENNKAEASNFIKVVDKLKRIYAFNKASPLTSWITDDTNIFKSQLGTGTGVIEITNFTSITTSCTTNINTPGRVALTISDPYETMVITEYDIERAIADATNVFNNHSFFSVFGTKTADQVISDLTGRLNAIRRYRNASPISFYTNPNTVLGRRINAIIDRIGVEIKFQFYYPQSIFTNGTIVETPFLKGGEIAGEDGLDDKPRGYGDIASAGKYAGQEGPTTHKGKESELNLFEQLVAAIYNKMSMETNARNALQQTNIKTNYARKKLRFNFLGKLIIQPMDSIHIYINSKSKYDNKLLGGLKDMFSGMSVLQSVSQSLTDIKTQWDSLFNPQSLSVAIEKAIFVGPEFPSFLWNMVRPQFVNENEGVHVFGGVIESSTGTWSAGKFTVSAIGSDNSYYFTLGKVNEKPGVDAWSGSIFDPLTPFKTKFDSVVTNYNNDSPILLDQNQIYLSKNNENEGPLLKFKAGPFAGQVVNDKNYITDKTVDPVTKQFIKMSYPPDGLVYKWKEGIGSFVQFGSSFDLNSPDKVGSPSITTDAFAGQDIMNVISLLVTGHPYNFATYWQAVSNFDGFNSDPHSKQNSSHSFSLSLKNNLQKRNLLWGNFIPFKTLVIDEATCAASMQSLFRIKENNSLIESKLKQLQYFETKSTALVMHAFDNDTLQRIKQNLSQKFIDDSKKASENLIIEINDLLKKLSEEDKKYLVQTGDDISFDFDEFLYSGNEKAKLGDAAERRMLRRKVNYLTRRMSYNVRANEDKNLFIVDDTYDKDYDIAAFNAGLANGLPLYNNQFLDVKNKITIAANLLNLEVFCDTQGHIRVRPPQYNRMPSSIFYKMMYQKSSLGITLFPQFLSDLFTTQLKTLKERLEVVEDQIRLDCAILGKAGDIAALEFINGSSAIAGTAVPFEFLSSSDGSIVDLVRLQQASTPDNNGAEFLTKIKSQASNTKDVFSSAQKFAFIKDTISKASANTSNNPYNVYNIIPSLDFENNILVNDIIKRIEIKSGQKVKNFIKDPVPPYTFKNDPNSVDIFKVTKDLSEKISERQKAVKLFYTALKNSKEYRSLDEDSSTANKLMLFGTYGNKNIPEVFEHMIEDETYDDLGPGSGKRYIIKNSQILNYTISENPPDYTYVEVQGTLNKFAPESLPNGLDRSTPLGGNGMMTAAAIDYDLWRNYGLKTAGPINVPFLSDPISQCAPYAVTMLSRARNQILNGNITITGNEFMQPGEVIYLENRGLLFYVTQVSHNFNQGNSFTTTLQLSYGHSPGEYIPTTLDVIGKAIYNNKDIASYQIHKQSNSFNESNYGVIIRDPNAQKVTSSQVSSGGGGAVGPANATVINNILYTTSYLVYSNSTQGNNIKAIVELRIYYDKKIGPVNPELKKFAEEIKKILIGTSVLDQPKIKNSKKTITLPDKAVEIKEIDISSETDYRSPSQKAHSIARDLIEIANFVSTSTTPFPVPIETPADKNNSEPLMIVAPNVIKQERDKIRRALFGNIIDCWVKLETLPPETTSKTTATTTTTTKNTPTGTSTTTTKTTTTTDIKKPLVPPFDPPADR